MIFKKKRCALDTLSLEQLLEGAYVGDYGSGYEHELFRTIQKRYEKAADKRGFLEEVIPALPGYDLLATDAIYRSRGIDDAFIFGLPDVEHIDPPACVLYRLPNAPPGATRSWSIVRFYHYKVLPNFYEPIGLHELCGWNLLDQFPDQDGWSPRTSERSSAYDDPRGSYCNASTGVITFGAGSKGARQALRYAADLKEAMRAIGVLANPPSSSVASGTTILTLRRLVHQRNCIRMPSPICPPSRTKQFTHHPSTRCPMATGY